MPSMADSFPFGVVTIWTAAYFDTGKGKQKSTELIESGVYFVSEEFNTVNAVKLSKHLKRCQSSTNNPDLPFIAIARVEGDTPWLSTELCSVFPLYPEDAIRDIVDSRRQQRGTVALPKIDKKLRALSFSMQYPYIHSNGSESHATELKINKYKFAPIVTWISTAAERPTILLVCRDEEIPRKLQSHLVSCNWQHSLLGRDPARIFIDLLVLLANWAEVLWIAQQELAQRNIQVHTDELPLLRKTRELHRDAEEIIALREDLRLHITAVRKFSLMVNAHRPVMTQLGLLCRKSVDSVCDAADEDLDEQVEECLQNLLHQQESAAVIHKQLENLLSLAFNTEMVSQGQAVARLNFLAFIFLPLSFVATLFGMTRFTISAAWYPLWAFVVVVLVLLGFLAANHLPNNLLKVPSNLLLRILSSNLLKTLGNKLRATTPVKNNKETKTPPKLESSTPKASKLAWIKPNPFWWVAVPVIGWCIIWFLLRRKRAREPYSSRHEAGPVPVPVPSYFGDHPESTKVPTPMSHSYLRGAGLHQHHCPPTELDPDLLLRPQYELWSRPSLESDGPQIESSSIRWPWTPNIGSSQGSRV